MRRFRLGRILGWRFGPLLALALCAGGQTNPQIFQTTTFGMIGLAPNQVARVNVLNPGAAADGNNPVCSAEMQFLDSDGRMLKSATAQVDGGKAVLLDLDRGELANPTGRVQIRAVVKTSISRPNPVDPFPVMPGSVCSFFPTLEIFDTDTGKTVLVMSEGRSLVSSIPLNGAPARLTR